MRLSSATKLALSAALSFMSSKSFAGGSGGNTYYFAHCAGAFSVILNDNVDTWHVREVPPAVPGWTIQPRIFEATSNHSSVDEIRIGFLRNPEKFYFVGPRKKRLGDFSATEPATLVWNGAPIDCTVDNSYLE